MMSVKASCEKCNEVFDVNALSVKEEQVVILEDGKELIITYYDCPKCGCKHMVQLDDENTKYLLNEVKKMIKKVAIRKRKGKSVKLIKNKYDKLNLDLNNMRNSLNIKYQGKHFEIHVVDDVITKHEVILKCMSFK